MSRVCKCYLKKYLLLVVALALAAGILIAPATTEAGASGHDQCRYHYIETSGYTGAYPQKS